jgi:hypothetical protein
MQWNRVWFLVFGLGWVSAEAGKQKILLQLREPLRPAAVEIVLPAVTNARGETRDAKAVLNLGDSAALPVVKPRHVKDDVLELDMTVERAGQQSLAVRITLPQSAFVEVFLMDVYGKNLGTLLSAQCPRGELFLKPNVLKEKESGGLRFLAMRINGKIAIQRVLPQVKG